MVAVEQYLKTVYRSDRDYINGEVLKRNWGEQSHGRLQGQIGVWLLERKDGSHFRTVPEVSCEIAPCLTPYRRYFRYFRYFRRCLTKTCSILAAPDLHDGHVIDCVEWRHRSIEFIALLKDLDTYYLPECSTFLRHIRVASWDGLKAAYSAASPKSTPPRYPVAGRNSGLSTRLCFVETIC